MDRAQSRLHSDDWATQAQQSKRNQTHEETETNEAGHDFLEENIKSECGTEHQGATQERQQCSSFCLLRTELQLCKLFLSLLYFA